MNGLGNDYMYQQAIRRRRNTPPEVSATPSLRDVTMTYAARQAQSDTAAVETSNRARLGDLRLAENARRFNAELGLEREAMDDARRAGLWASGIELANLAGTGLGAIAMGRQNDRNRQMQNQVLAVQQKALAQQQAQHRDILKLYQDMIGRFKI